MLSPSFQPEGTIALVIRANRLPHYALILLSVCIYFTIFRSKSNQMFDIFSRKKIASSTVQSLGYYFFNMFNLITVWGHADIPYKIIIFQLISQHFTVLFQKFFRCNTKQFLSCSTHPTRTISALHLVLPI